MALSSSKLADELEAMVPVETEAQGINNFATAFENYFYQSTCGGVIAAPGSLTAATSALKAALVGVNAAGAGAAKIASAITAFWGVVAGSAATIWVVAPPLVAATPPAGLAGLSAAVQAAATANISGGASLEDSASAMATAIHGCQTGGIGVITTPPGGTLPIL